MKKRKIPIKEMENLLVSDAVDHMDCVCSLLRDMQHCDQAVLLNAAGEIYAASNTQSAWRTQFLDFCKEANIWADTKGSISTVQIQTNPYVQVLRKRKRKVIAYPLTFGEKNVGNLLLQVSWSSKKPSNEALQLLSGYLYGRQYQPSNRNESLIGPIPEEKNSLKNWVEHLLQVAKVNEKQQLLIFRRFCQDVMNRYELEGTEVYRLSEHIWVAYLQEGFDIRWKEVVLRYQEDTKKLDGMTGAVYLTRCDQSLTCLVQSVATLQEGEVRTDSGTDDVASIPETLTVENLEMSVEKEQNYSKTQDRNSSQEIGGATKKKSIDEKKRPVKRKKKLESADMVDLSAFGIGFSWDDEDEKEEA